MDHSLLMADLTKISSKKSLKSVKLILPQIQIWQEAIKQLMINIRTKDSHEIEHSRHQLKFSQNEVVQLEEQLMKDRKQITSELYLFRMLESIRRLCAYARDFGEVLFEYQITRRILQ